MTLSSISRISRRRSTELSPKEVNTMDNGIQVTTDYDQFQILEANREQSRGHIEALKAAFEEMGNLTRVQPILVNDRMEIIDGQHRFTACKELGEPIYYTQVSGLGVSDARQMNILHRRWEFGDYARSYALGGDANYQRFLNLMEDFGFNGSVTLYYCSGAKSKGAFKNFRNGAFTLSPDEVVTAKERLEKLKELADLNPLFETITLAIAYLNVSQVSGFDHNRLVSRLERNPNMLTRQGGTPEYMRVLEDIYNYNISADNRVRLF